MRTSGILLPISSLPSPYGIGTLGKQAYAFVDFLVAAKQTYWQLLPIGPTSVGDSPYQSCSFYAGNPYFVDLDTLLEQGLLEQDDFADTAWGADASRVDYGALNDCRESLLEKAYGRGKQLDSKGFAAFRAANAWVEDYALFLALKRKFGYLPWSQWPEKAAMRDKQALARYRGELAEDVGYYAFVQYLFYGQWEKLHAYAKEKGVRIIGDLPIYVPMDSVDVWMYPQLFQLDEARRPKAVSGCPPDAFTQDGQLWGNPLYNWNEMKKDRYGWWQARVKAAAAFFDVIRIDHFRGLESYWAVPYGEETARNGVWVKGPGMSLIRALKKACPQTDFIAEDLGYMTPEVLALQKASGFPGMKVLQFAFGGDDSAYLPHRCIRNCICYTGTHDNETLKQWLDGADEHTLQYVRSYLGLNEQEGYVRGMLRGGMSTVADTFISQLQDWLELGAEGRMNTPGTISPKNWSWRLQAIPDASLAAQIAEMTQRYFRCENGAQP